MSRFDVFNGDADGICALHQLRLVHPAADAALVTGVKRDIALLGRVDAQAGDEVTVLDIAVQKNIDALRRILARGARVRWFDHHRGDIPQHPSFDPHIDTGAECCTSLLVNRWIGGRHLVWAIVAAFGDNLYEAAMRAAAPLDFSPIRLAQLRRLGEAINYNAYGSNIDDLYFAPDDLYRAVHAYTDPFEFIDAAPEFKILREGYAADMALADVLQPELAEPWGAVYVLPGTIWARRVSGAWANGLARAAPERAHAVLTCRDGGGYQVSVRAPLSTRTGADELSALFPTGGGRRAAAGINHLHEAELGRFIDAFGRVFGKDASA